MVTWSRPTDLRRMGSGLEETSQRACVHICIAPGPRQLGGEGRPGWGWEVGGKRGTTWGVSVIIGNNVHNKNI